MTTAAAGRDDAAKARPVRTHLTARAKARKRAVDILFEADLRESDLQATLAERTADADPQVPPYAAELVRGVARHQLALDQRIAESLPIQWTLERMARTDRCIARVAMLELDHSSLPTGVVISEAAALAGDISTDESPSFLSGMLGKAAETRQTPEKP